MNTNVTAPSGNHSKYGPTHKPVLKVLGLGGGGCNAVNRMMEHGIKGVEFIGANTDHQALQQCLAPTKIALGMQTARGLGAGGRPEVGEAAALESSREIAAALAGADMVFLTAGMGGGTGTGSIPVAAEIARKQGAVTVAIVTTPFTFEMGRRQKNAHNGLVRLNRHTDTLIAISNDRLLDIRGGKLTMDLAFRVADDVLRQAVQGVSDLIGHSGYINVDFSHIQRVMRLGGGALLATGQGQGSEKASQAIHRALHHPLLDNVALDNAAAILVNITGGDDLSLFEVNEALSQLHAQTNHETEIVMGVVRDESMNDRVEVFMIVTGLGGTTLEEVLPGAERLHAAKTTVAAEPEAVFVASEAPSSIAEHQPMVSGPALATGNLDLPAFLRRDRYTRRFGTAAG